jgi:lysophospholipase L1-like esterase
MFQLNKFKLVTMPATLALLSVAAHTGNAQNPSYTYLALGDSISYGLNVTLLSQVPLPTPSQFTGYPEIIAEFEHLSQPKKEVNASCPGLTSGSFISGAAPDNGCYSPGPQGQPPFKTWIGLHTNYSGSQLAFATSQLAANKHIDLVTLSIGGNDILLLLGQCLGDPACVNAKLPGVLATYGQNLAQILAGIRHVYGGTLVLVTYFSPSAPLDPVALALNSVITSVGTPFQAKFADGFTAFKLGSAFFGGDPCQAGLLVRLSPTTCDVHPTFAGQALLAAAVEVAIFEKH